MHYAQSVRRKYSAAWVTYFTKRVYNRFDHHRRTSEHLRKPVDKGNQTWASCLENNKGKLLARYDGREKPSAFDRWQGCFQFQRKKVECRLDPYERWRRKEYKQLDKINNLSLASPAFPNALWAFRAKVQVNKLNSDYPYRKWRLPQTKKWSDVIKNVRTRLCKGSIPERSDSWAMACKANVAKMHGVLGANSWQSCYDSNREKLASGVRRGASTHDLFDN